MTTQSKTWDFILSLTAKNTLRLRCFVFFFKFPDTNVRVTLLNTLTVLTTNLKITLCQLWSDTSVLSMICISAVVVMSGTVENTTEVGETELETYNKELWMREQINSLKIQTEAGK